MKNFLVIFVLLCGVAGRAETPAERVAGLLTPETVAVARLHVAAMEPEALRQAVTPFLPLVGSPGEAAVETMVAGLKSARQAGIEEFFAVLDTADLPQQPVYFLIPIPAGRDAEPISVWLRGMLSPERVELRDGMVFGGSRASWNRLSREGANGARPDLAAAFEAVSAAPIQLAIIPSPDHRRVLRELLPDLPAELGGARGETIAAGLRWGAIGMTVAPALTARMVIQAETEAGATALRQTAVAGLERLVADQAIAESLPMLPKLVGLLGPVQEGDRLTLSLDGPLHTLRLLLSAAGIERAAQAARQRADMNNLKQLGLALHNFHDVHGSFPSSASYDGEGRPLLSWRVFVLPFLGQQALYEKFRLHEPWDSPHNRALLAQMPAVFGSTREGHKPGETTILAPTGPGLMFDGRAGIPLQAVTDGTSNTIALLEATPARAVPWTKPSDLAIDPNDPLAGLIQDRESFPVLFGDGSVRMLSTTLDPATFLKILTRGGGEVINSDELP